MAIEEPVYDVIKKKGDIELRQYQTFHVAEVAVDGAMEEAGNAGFQPLFKYISGQNAGRTSIPMTAPVIMEHDAPTTPGGPATLATTPATPAPDFSAGQKWRVAFVMPASYTKDSLPAPRNAAVRLQAVPPRRVAVIQYSGRWTKENFDKKLAALRAWMADEGLEPASDPIWARYDPPFKPAFLRRNEIQIPVKSAPAQ